MQAGSRRPQGGRKGPIYPRLTTASLVVGLVGIALIAFAQWLRWMGGRGDPLHWAERTENILPLALPANEPCASRSGFGLPVCANATAGAHVQYLYPLVNAPYTGAFRAPAVTHLDVVLSDAIPEQSVIVRAPSPRSLAPSASRMRSAPARRAPPAGWLAPAPRRTHHPPAALARRSARDAAAAPRIRARLTHSAALTALRRPLLQSPQVSIHQQEAIIRRNLGALLRLSTGSWRGRPRP